jgi:hypothetical protein
VSILLHNDCVQCGGSLASAKGRRKHEKKHCPATTPTHTPTSSSSYYPGQHSLFSRVVRMPLKRFGCRHCGKVLKTYEGRRLHEKVHHAPIAAENSSPSAVKEIRMKAETGSGMYPSESVEQARVTILHFIFNIGKQGASVI